MGSRVNGGASIQQTFDGGYIIAGTPSTSQAGKGYIYLVKTDSSGTIKWERAFGGIGDPSGNHVQQTADGGYIIVGTTTFPYTNTFSDVYVIKLKPEAPRF